MVAGLGMILEFLVSIMGLDLIVFIEVRIL